jgi:hypothetical protein
LCEARRGAYQGRGDLTSSPGQLSVEEGKPEEFGQDVIVPRVTHYLCHRAMLLAGCGREPSQKWRLKDLAVLLVVGKGPTPTG